MKTKLKKFGAWLMAAALAFAGAGAVQAAVQVTDQTELDNALSAAKSGDVIQITQAGEYELNKLGGSGYTLEATVAGVTLQRKKYTTSQPENYVSSCTGLVTLKNLAWDMTVNAYYPHFKNIHAVDCTFTGLLFAEETCIFEHCTFNAIETEYNLWCYHGPVTFTDCTFNGAGKFLHLYNESNYVGDQLWEVTVDGCTFNSSKKGKAAVNVKARCNGSAMRYDLVVKNCKIAEGGDNFPEASASDTLIVFNKFIQLDQISASVPNVITLTYEGDVIYKDNTVLEVAKKEVEVVTPTVSEEKGITQQIADQIASNTEVTKVEDTGLKAALAKDETLKDAEAVVKVELTKAAKDETGVLTYEIKPVVKGEGESPDEDISDKVVGKPITFRVPLTDAFTKFAKVTHKGTVDEISHAEVLGASGSRYVELTFTHFSEVEFDPELTFPDLPETAVKVADGFYQSAATYAGSSDFYIVNKAGLEYLRDFVNRDRTDYSDGPSFDYSSKVFSGKTVHLLVDIDLNNEPWVSIGWNADKSFCGSFNGENHTISNMKIVNETITANKGFYAGLFGYLAWDNTTFQNLTFNNVIVKNVSNYAGALCGRYTKVTGAIKNIKVTGTVDIGATSFVGGIAGHNAAQMSNCSVDAAGQVKSTAGGWCGGIAGYVAENSATVIKECSVKGGVSLTGTNIAVGGITGHVGGANVIKDCTVEAAITGGAAGSTGAIAGKMEGTSAAEIVNNDSTKVVDGNGTVLENQLGGAYSDAATCIVGTGVTYDENGKVNGGTFESLPESAIAEGFEPVIDPETGKTVVEKIKVAEVFDGDVSMGKFETLDEALAEATDGKTLKLLTDLDNIGTKALNGIVFDGNGHKITGASALYCGAEKTTTITNVVFENIHNAGNDQSAIYGEEFSTGSITITGCTFDNVDWDAIQIVPVNDATGKIVIRDNIFKHTDTTKTQLRYIHVQHAEQTDMYAVYLGITITDNQFLDTDKSAGEDKISSVMFYKVASGSTFKLDGNYFDDTSTIYNDMASIPLRMFYPMRSKPDVDVDDVLFPLFSIGTETYTTLADAVAAANLMSQPTIRLNGDLVVDVTVEINNVNGSLVTFNAAGFNIQAKVAMFDVKTKASFYGDNGIPPQPGLVTCPSEAPVFNVDNGVSLVIQNAVFSKDVSYLVANPHKNVCVQREDGNYEIVALTDALARENGYVAKDDDGAYYKSITELIAAQTGKAVKIYLIANVTEDVECTTGKWVAFNGGAYTYSGNFKFDSAKWLTMNDGTANMTSLIGGDVNVYGPSTMTINDGNVKSVSAYDDPTLVIKGGIYGSNPASYVDDEIYDVTPLETNPQTWKVTEKTSIAAVVSAGGIQTNEYKTLSKALQVAQANEKVILLADTAEANVPLKPDQEIVLNGHAFTGTVNPALVPAGYDAMVTTPDGKVFSAPAKVTVEIGGGSVIKVRMLDTAENLATPQANGRPLWANKALGIANDFVIKPQVERPEVGSKTISIKSNIPDSVLAAAAQQRDGVSVKFQLAKKVGSVGTYVQFGEKQPKPEFTVAADEQEVQTFWKIQIFFEEEY